MSKFTDVSQRGTNAARPAANAVPTGALYYDTTNSQLTRSNGSTWDVVEGTGGFANPMTTLGDIITGGSSGTPGRLAKGSDSTVLTIDPSTHVPVWAASAGMTNPMTTQDDIIVGGASGTPARLAKGSDGQVLTVDPSTHHLVWAASAGASFATPAIVLGTAAAAGAASTVIRSDSTIVAFDATAPSTQAFGDAAATGSATVAARRDHKHAMPAAPISYGTLASLPAAGTQNRIYYCTDDDFVFIDTGSDWQIFHLGQYIGLQSAVPVVSSFTHTLTAGGGSAADSKAGLKLTQPSHSTGDSYDLWSVALPSTTGPWTATMYLRPDMYAPKNFHMALLALLTASGGSSMDMFGLSSLNGAFNAGTSQYQSSSTTVSTISVDIPNAWTLGIWLRVHDDGAASSTSRTWSAGRTLAQLATYATVSHTLTITPARVGILLNARNAAVPNIPLAITVPYWTVINS